ncbi:BNR repeat-containing protein [Polaribacter reichenbachii]|uniref:BNR repeat-containing protein n=1 Tax=Polaribacter reichenbachii TaxID=996801 RepID=UPI001D0CCB03|nr:BNR repeat-containing protein [Polaribacter reichenbachii]
MSCSKSITYLKVGKGWSNNSVNTVKFRKNALTTYKRHQFVGYYDGDGYLVLGKRKINSNTWQTVKTSYKGNVKDAHNAISIAVDGNGFLHISWDHHNTKLRYAISKEPLSLNLGEEIAMTGKQEDKVTYPEFYNLPNGNLLFFYRSGESGRGNLVINSYDVKDKKWTQLHQNLIDGENIRSAYWQICVDNTGIIHMSWVWRETWNVETNHDLCYARSLDDGKTWQKSTKEKYNLPITLASAEYAWRIPQDSNLINQTATATDNIGNPYIATYFNENKITQYQVVFLENGIWKKKNTGFRKTPFQLGGGGTKRIPISRPDILIDNSGEKNKINILFRDLERGNKVSLAYSNLDNNSPWKVIDLSENAVGEWEPNYDISLWNKQQKLNIFYQNVTQVDGEGVANKKPSKVEVLQINNLSEILN